MRSKRLFNETFTIYIYDSLALFMIWNGFVNKSFDSKYMRA